MILISNTRALLPNIVQALEQANVPFASPRVESFWDTRAGRYILALLRIACNHDDYIAHRLLVGLKPQVGIATCDQIAKVVISNTLNYRDIFYQSIPQGLFRGRALKAVNCARETCAKIANWQPTDTIAQHSQEIDNIVQEYFDQPDAECWRSQIADLPPGMSLVEVRDYLCADNDDQRASLLHTTYLRLGIPKPASVFVPPKVQIMTMHGAKGLSATVVFVPGLENDIFPGPRRQPYPGLVLEAARMLYVSITRARAACVLSYAQTRVTYGEFARGVPSQFVSHLGGTFVARANGLQDHEVQQIIHSRGNL
jgi:DNA helicase-2/ATP-dependent DNA helicase PcrA